MSIIGSAVDLSTYRLAEAHLVGQDAVDPILVERDEPLDALELVVAQVSLNQRQKLLQGVWGGEA